MCGMYGLHVIVKLSIIIIDGNKKERNTKTRSTSTIIIMLQSKRHTNSNMLSTAATLHFYTKWLGLHIRDERTNGRTDNETRLFVRCAFQERPSYGWTNRDAS